MKYLFNINQYTKRIYEGGGAGISITTNITIYGGFNIGYNKISDFKYDSSFDDTMDVVGYDDGMRDVSTEDMFDVKAPVFSYKDVANIEVKSIKDITYVEDFEEIFTNYKDEETIGEYLNNNKEKEIAVEFELNMLIYHTLFGGYVRGDVNVGIELDRPTLSGGNNYLNINGCYADIESDNLFEIVPTVTLAQRFVEFYEDVFKNIDDLYRDYVKDLAEDEKTDEDVDELVNNAVYWDEFYYWLKDMWS